MEQLILVVEDNPFYGKLVALMLAKNISCRVQLAETGHEALDIAKKFLPTFFLLDYQLPDMNGIKLYDQLHMIEGCETVPAILFSADLPNQEIEAQLLARGIVGISKSFDMRPIVLAITEQIDQNGDLSQSREHSRKIG